MASTPYKHFVPPVPLNPDYDKDFTYILIESLEQLEKSFKNGFVIAWDTETTGLNPAESEIVGFSYTYDGKTGYYCPVKHFDLALGKPALDLFYHALKESKLQLLYNARFDIRMMEYSGYDMSFLYPKDKNSGKSNAVFVDVMNQVWLSDTNIPLPSLKSSTLHFLGYQPPKFLETLGDEQNFKYVPAKDAYRYACFTDDTLIQTKQGLKQIKELKTDIDLIKTSNGYHKLLAVLDQGVHSVIKVTTPIGTSFTCTPDHKFSVEINQNLSWVCAKDLDKVPFYCLYRGGKSLNDIENTLTFDTAQKAKKSCCIEYLEEKQQVYDLSIESEHNFSLQCGIIAHNCLDAINTMNLFRVTFRYYKEAGLAAQLDNACVYIIGQLEKTPLNINTDYLVTLRDKVYNRVLEIEKEIYELVGHPFKIGSNRELTNVFLEQGIDTGERTKAGDMKTGIELLNLYLRNHPDCTLLKLLIEYKEQFKFYNSYLKTLVDIAKKQDTVPPRFSYKLQSVPCLTENNLVLIKDKGVVPIKFVKEQDYIWTQFGFKRVLWANAHKSNNIYRVRLDNSFFIEGTGHHPILINKGSEYDVQLEWATLDDVKCGERVVLNHHTPNTNSLDKDDDVIKQYLLYLGFISASFMESSVKSLEEYKEVKEDLIHNASESLQFLVKSCNDSESLSALLFSTSPKYWPSFLSGLFDALFETDKAQQWNKHNSNEFIAYSEDTLFLSTISNILIFLGIKTNIYFDEARGSYLISIKSTPSLSILKHLVIDYTESPYLYDLFNSFFISDYYLEYEDALVSNIEKVDGESTVYDIEVEDVHEYVANGIVTHNTGRLATGKDGKNTYFAPINLQCLEENTLIKTDRGNIPIKEVTNNDLVWTGTKFVPCKQLGSKRKECFKIKTFWGEIEASLEHRFLALNIYDNYNIEWYTLAECISRGLPIVRDPQALGISFDEVYHHPIFSDHSDKEYKYPTIYKNIWVPRKELSLEEYKEKLEYYKDYKFDIIIDVSWQFWRPHLVNEPSLIKTVYDLYVPEYNQFTANGFIVHNSLPKPHSIKCYARKATQEEIENKKDVLGWVFSPDHPEWSPGMVVEGMDQNLNVRAAFLPEHPEDGDYVVSIDQSAEELRIVTLLFKQMNWAKVLNEGGDLHHANSDAIFGPENYTKETRKRSKGAAFGILYGQEYRGFQRKFPDMSLDEAQEFMSKFKKTIPNIVRGQERMIKEAQRTGTFYTAFGRPRRVKHYMTSSDYKDVAFGKRTCYSPDTEFLTKDGWKLAKDIKEDTLLAYYDPITKSTSFTKAGERVVQVSTESIQYKGRSSSWNVTPNHRMWIRNTSREKFRFVEAQHLLSLSCCQCIGSSYLDSSLEEKSQKIETPLGEYNKEDLAELFGWILTDGTISKNLDTISISQSKPKNFSRLKTLVGKFHGVFYNKTLDNRIPFRSKSLLLCNICRRAFNIWVVDQIKGRLKIDRHIPEWIFTSSLNVRKKFIEAMLLGDGRLYKDKISGSFDTQSKSIADEFQLILNLSGYRSIVRPYKNQNFTDMYSVSYCLNEYINLDFRTRKNSSCNIQKVKHEPLEYSCFTVPSGILITRYNGYISYMGNCMNGPIQGTAADVLKLELVRLWDHIFTVYPEIKFIVTIHDEINYSVPRRLAHEVIPKLVRIQTVQMPDWVVPLTASLSVGDSLGNVYPLVYDFNTKEFHPDWEEDKRKETQENKEEEVSDSDNNIDISEQQDDFIEDIDSHMFDF